MVMVGWKCLGANINILIIIIRIVRPKTTRNGHPYWQSLKCFSGLTRSSLVLGPIFKFFIRFEFLTSKLPCTPILLKSFKKSLAQKRVSGPKGGLVQNFEWSTLHDLQNRLQQTGRLYLFLVLKSSQTGKPSL
jgi:hypothetical protein